jgi:hypothetical protein
MKWTDIVEDRQAVHGTITDLFQKSKDQHDHFR